MTGIRSPTGKIDRGDVEEGKSGPQHMLRATQLLPACDANYLSTKTEEERQKALLAISAGYKPVEKAREVEVLLVS